MTAATLERDAQEFLRFKRAMGIAYRRAEFVLHGFVCFVAQHWGRHGAVSLQEAVLRWTTRTAGRKAVTVANEFGVVRQLCLFRRRRDPGGYVPEHAIAPVKESVFLPCIFTHEQVRQLLAAATAHEGRSMWGGMLRALVLVLYCTGLRLGEAVRLHAADVDLAQGMLIVRHSKGRSRIVPVRADLAQELQCYARLRQQLLQSTGCAEPPAFFLRRDGSALTVHSASDVLRRFLCELGMKPPRGRIGARPYEFRHTFAVHRLTAWAQQGVDVHARLPWLSAYLGHQNVLGTEVYLKATPELLELASRRFKAHVHGRRRQPR
ncbi:tyrosine-type recombinase/integrase [Azohydromonas aeria]|uniref:tyrosine-type recombinase/integrase n=1 Tax=Azohydromonas aeria TaxID=2590212 RepID=UPI001E3F88F7|nr:tyrosine-type recombinase/integrase [Azohydromonas aeria]